MKLRHIHIKRLFCLFKEDWKRVHCVFLVKYLYGDIWRLREICATTHNPKHINLYKAYMDYHCASINYEAKIDGVPTFPHGILGVFVSRYAHIGKGCVIFQHVTIGSNTLKDSKMRGAAVIGDGVMIGAGAMIIGAVTIGDNARIGAGCVVVKDVPPNTTVVSAANRMIVHDRELDNTFTGQIKQR